MSFKTTETDYFSLLHIIKKLTTGIYKGQREQLFCELTAKKQRSCCHSTLHVSVDVILTGEKHEFKQRTLSSGRDGMEPPKSSWLHEEGEYWKLDLGWNKIVSPSSVTDTYCSVLFLLRSFKTFHVKIVVTICIICMKLIQQNKQCNPCCLSNESNTMFTHLKYHFCIFSICLVFIWAKVWWSIFRNPKSTTWNANTELLCCFSGIYLSQSMH